MHLSVLNLGKTLVNNNNSLLPYMIRMSLCKIMKTRHLSTYEISISFILISFIFLTYSLPLILLYTTFFVVVPKIVLWFPVSNDSIFGTV